MKIIRRGILPKDQLYHGTCRHCNALVRCSYDEVSRRDLGDRYAGEFIEHSVKCPTPGCNHQIILSEGKEP